jgi:hypothetical protein
MKGVFRDHNSQTLDVKTESVKKCVTSRNEGALFQYSTENETLMQPGIQTRVPVFEITCFTV